MSTVNGFGTQYFDWEHLSDGTSNATNWIVAGFFPIMPLGRYHVQVHTSGEKTSFFSLSSGSFQVSYDTLEKIPMNFARILRTYAKGWLLMPFVLLAPFMIPVALIRVLGGPQGGGMTSDQEIIMGVFAISYILYVAILVARILDKCSGR